MIEGNSMFKKILISSRRLCFFLGLSLLTGNWAVASDQAYSYVNASRLAARKQPSSDSSIVAYFPTNTRVKVLTRDLSWCGVRTDKADDTVFVDCRFLVEQPLNSGEIETALKKGGLPPNVQRDLLQKLFWIQPNWTRLEAYGAALTRDLLSVQDLQIEMTTYQSRRPKRAEFEAMKQRLRQGWTAEVPVLPVFDRKTLGKFGIKRLPAAEKSLFDTVNVSLIYSPHVGGSYGQRDIVYMAKESLGSGLAHWQITDWLAFHAQNRTLRVVDFGRPTAPKYGGPLQGTWDVGGSDIQLSDAGVEVLGLAADGRTMQLKLTSVSDLGEMSDAECDQIGITIKLNKRIAKAQTEAGVLVFLLNPKSIGASLPKRLFAKTFQFDDGENTEFTALFPEFGPGESGFTHARDLNWDNKVDIAFVGAIGGQSTLSTGPSISRAFQVFLNVSGKWHLTGKFAPKYCGG